MHLGRGSMDEQVQAQERVALEEELSPIIIPLSLYRFFLANGKIGREAKAVWEHLVYTARLQETNQVKATNTYIQNGLELGERKVKQLKSWLKKHGLISYVQRKDDKGRIIETYIRVHASSQAIGTVEPEKVSTGAETARVENRTGGSDGQMLKGTSKCLKEEGKGDPLEEFPPPISSNGREILEGITNEYNSAGFPLTIDKNHKAQIDRTVAQHGKDAYLVALRGYLANQKERGKSDAPLHYLHSQFAEHLERGKADDKKRNKEDERRRREREEREQWKREAEEAREDREHTLADMRAHGWDPEIHNAVAFVLLKERGELDSYEPIPAAPEGPSCLWLPGILDQYRKTANVA